MKTDFISGIDTEKLFTTSTNQIIPADIKFTRIVANEINCNDINGIDISHEAANTIDGRIITGKYLRIINLIKPEFRSDHILFDTKSKKSLM